MKSRRRIKKKEWKKNKAVSKYRIIHTLLDFVVGEIILIIIHSLCYSDFLWMIPIQILLIPYFSIIKSRRKKQKICQYEKGFRELLQSMMTSLQAGYSVENACRAALKELEGLYQNRRHPILKDLRKIVRGIELNIPVDQLFMDFAKTAELNEIYQFAAVLEIARNTGGNMVEILKNSMEHLQGKMDANEKIEVILSGKKFEKNIMLLIPFGMLFYLRVTNSDYISCFYTTIPGRVLMTAVLCVTLACFYWTEKIMRIEF